MNNDLCQECKEKPVTTLFKISENQFMHLCPLCFNKVMSESMAIDLEDYETKEFSYKDEHGDQYAIHIENLGYPMGIGYEIRQSINDGSDHNISSMGKIECNQNEIWNQLVIKIESTIHTRYLELVNTPHGEAQDQLIGNEVAGKIEYDGNRYDEIPKLIIDDKKYTWKEFGRMLSPSGGLRFKLHIYEQVEKLSQ